MTDLTGVVIIGRNEGERLRSCLRSISNGKIDVVYVDSGSTDNSLNIAQESGAFIVNLDVSIPFTAARARNTGYKKLREINPDTGFVQFVDGDCTMVDGWIEHAVSFLREHPEVAIACGRRRERYPETSKYNYLCDLEWDTPVGEARACGGDFLVRIEAFDEVHGFNGALIAGEEPDMCFRLRQSGWKIWRLDMDMTLHDANMQHFNQWWRRMKRAGYAFIDGAVRNGRSPEFYWVREAISSWVWVVIFPLFIVLAFLFEPWLAVLVALVYPAQLIRLYLKSDIKHYRLFRAVSLIIGKFAEFSGQLEYLYKRSTGKRQEIIEYK